MKARSVRQCQCLAECETGLRVTSEIADAIGTTVSAVSQAMRRLSSLGLVLSSEIRVVTGPRGRTGIVHRWRLSARGRRELETMRRALAPRLPSDADTACPDSDT